MAEKAFGYRVIAPTGDGATDSAAYQAWVISNPRPTLFLTPNGNNFVITSPSNKVTSGDFRIEGNGVKMIQQYSALNPLINIERTMTTPQDTVTAISDVDFDISDTGLVSLSTRITLSVAANVANYPIGSFALLSSEDTAPHGGSAEGPRMGQVMRISKTDAVNGYIYFATTAWREDLYTTDIRITGLPTGETYINNLRLDIAAVSGEDIDLRRSPVVWVQNCVQPTLTNLDIIESPSIGIYVARAVGGVVANCKVRKVRFTSPTSDGSPSNSRLGYGIYMQACDGLAVRNNYFTNCRHGISDNWFDASAAGATPRHGGNMNILIANNVSAFTKAAGLDWHSSAIGNLMTGNIVYGARTDATGLGAGYQIRGESNVLIGNSDYDCEVGIQIFENTIDGTQDAYVIDHVSRSKKIGIVLDGHASSTRKLNANIIGGIFETKQVGAAAGVMVQARRAKVSFRGTTFKPRGQNGGNLFDLRGDTIVSGDVNYDPHNAAGTWAYQTTSGSNNDNRVAVHRDADDAAPGDAAYVITDNSPDVISYATTLTANRAVTFSCAGRKRVLIKRTADGAFDLTVAHSGSASPQVLAQNEAVELIVHGATVILASGVLELA